MSTPAQAPTFQESLERPTLAHVAPFVAWLFVAHMLGDPEGWKYALRSVLCLGIFVWLRPWRWYPRIDLRHLPLVLLTGAGVCVLWVMGESAWLQKAAPGLSEFYVRWCVLPFGELRDPEAGLSYAPENTGWPLTMARIAGSALVIGVIEEFFWRGWLYRWMLGRNFLEVDPGVTFNRISFFAVALVFGLEHREWLAGWLAGLAYAGLYLKTRDLWAVALAHALTNALLGWYIVSTGAYWFWS